ncbi:hypothetical protein [Virgibacillus halodenitrificans]|nr:hypothetical protein [Virgibacillus halodenitrificans]
MRMSIIVEMTDIAKRKSGVNVYHKGDDGHYEEEIACEYLS